MTRNLSGSIWTLPLRILDLDRTYWTLAFVYFSFFFILFLHIRVLD